MTLRYGSVCSGIEAATVAWHPLGWVPVFFSEIDTFPSAVLAHHYGSNMPNEDLARNGVPNYGDFTQIPASAGGEAGLDLLVGGTPCQSFSIAGLRGGLDDARGNLALEFCRLARRIGPRWVVWENVPGVLSLDGGRAFASILGGLADCGYGLAYRVLDAQFVRVDGFGRAVPQRRRRVFVVGYLGDWRRAAAVLFERESLSGNPPPRRSTRQDVAGSLKAGLGRRQCDNGECGTLISVATSPTLDANFGRLQGASGQDAKHGHGHLVAHATVAASGRLPAGQSPRTSKDGPRYKALGNSMAVNVMRWIGRRIAAVDGIPAQGGKQPSR
jgi:DNA (cytosine-5)-methyltransferase 1